MLKLEVGSKVVMSEKGMEVWAEIDPDSMMCRPDTVLVIIDVDEDDDVHPYLVETLGDMHEDSWVSESELEHYEESMEND